MTAAEWERAKSLIMAVLTRPPGERQAFLQQHCPDPALRAEIDLLVTDGGTAPIATPNFPSVTATEPAKLNRGTRIGPYEILESAGRGGMGQVFVARDVRLARKVALKCVFSSRGDTGDLKPRVLSEARAAARIKHPNVAAVHDIVEDGPDAFIVMEYVEGQTVARLLADGPLPIRSVVTIGRQLASALAAAHEVGVVHRDLKPANIQVTAKDFVKVLDFGVAKVSPLRAGTTVFPADTVVAAVGIRVGTPGYMSPEQLLGCDVDGRSDIFSLGVVLCEMATGRRPCPATDAAHLIFAMTRPLARADDLDSRVPRVLADIIDRALQIDPARRFQSAADLESALVAYEGAAANEFNAGLDDRALTIRRLREQLIAANSGYELLRVSYEVEQFVTDHPRDVDARMLAEAVRQAISAHKLLSPTSGADHGTYGGTPRRDSLPQARETWLRRYAAFGVALSLALAVGVTGLVLGRRPAVSTTDTTASVPTPVETERSPSIVTAPLPFDTVHQIPAGALLDVQLISPLSSDTAVVGDRVEARLINDVAVGGLVAIRSGAKIIGSVTFVDRSRTNPALVVRFHTLAVDGRQVPLAIDPIAERKPSLVAKAHEEGRFSGGAVVGAITPPGRKSTTTGAVEQQSAIVVLPAGSQARLQLRAPVVLAP